MSWFEGQCLGRGLEGLSLGLGLESQCLVVVNIIKKDKMHGAHFV